MTSRRKVLALGACVLAAPLSTLAQQQGRVWRIGFLHSERQAQNLPAFLRGMRDHGYTENKNLIMELRFADGQPQRLPGLATELVQAKVDVIVTVGSTTTAAAQKATATIPIVMTTVGDPVGSGFVKSLARPGGNITGLSNISIDLSPKHLEMLVGVVPNLSRVAVLINPTNPSERISLNNVVNAAKKSKITVLKAEAGSVQDIEKAFAVMAQAGAGAVIVSLNVLFNAQQRHVAELASRYRLPSISGRAEYAESGFLVGYGPSTSEMFRRTADYVDRILKGTKAAELPVEEPTKLELFINRKTAKALGLTIPQSLLISADKVIE